MNADTAFALQDMQIHVVDCHEFFVAFSRAFLTQGVEHPWLDVTPEFAGVAVIR
jgi:hypothetical protein